MSGSLGSMTSLSSADVQNASYKEVHEAVIHISKLKGIIEPLVTELKRIPLFFEKRLPEFGLSENQEFLRILQLITDFTIDLDATFNNFTGVLGDLEELERTISTPTPHILVPPKGFTDRATDESLRTEVYNLRTTLNTEIALKERLLCELDEAKVDVKNYIKNVQELVDEKMTLQRELKTLDDDFNTLEAEHKTLVANYEKVVDGLSGARDPLAESRRLLSNKDKELRNVYAQLEALKNTVRFKVSSFSLIWIWF